MKFGDIDRSFYLNFFIWISRERKGSVYMDYVDYNQNPGGVERQNSFEHR